MKINNKKFIKRYVVIYSLIVLGCFFSILILLFNQIPYNHMMAILFGVLILILLIIIWKLRIIEIENSGMIVSIKQYHPLKKGIIYPVFEMPFTELRYLQISNKRFEHVLIINRIKDTGPETYLKFYFKGVEDQEIDRLRTSFKESYNFMQNDM